MPCPKPYLPTIHGINTLNNSRNTNASHQAQEEKAVAQNLNSRVGRRPSETPNLA